MTIKHKHNKVITIAGEVVKTFITLAIYVAIIAVVLVGLIHLSVVLGEWLHVIFN